MSDWEQLANALAWYKAAPARWLQSAKQDLSAAAQWIWEVIQGDFNDDQSTAQVVTGTVISMIPIVDQLCDVRDVVANCKKIDEDSDNTWAWVALVLTLIGLFPTLGSLVKGCLKILFAYGRKAVAKLGKAASTSDMWKLTQPVVEKGILKLNQHLHHPAVRKTLAALKIDNPWKELAKKVRELKGQLTVGALISAFDKVIGVLNDLLDLVKKWGSAALNTQAGQLLLKVKRVRDQANAKLAKVLKPVQDWLDKLAKRLDVEAEKSYPASTRAMNPHTYKRSELEELDEFEKKKPEWVDKTLDDPLHKAAQSYTHKDGWPDMREGSKSKTAGEFRTFEEGTIQPVTILPGETLYRVVAPNSRDNRVSWMRKGEFDQLTSKSEWRRKFAVWVNWNSNGEYVTYTVPPGKGLKVWEGNAASQEFRPNKVYKLEGGSPQLAIDPADLKEKIVGKRQPTGWGYGDFGSNPDMTGVPVLTKNWAK